MKRKWDKKPTAEEIRKRYERSVAFKNQIDLYHTVEENENFYIGNQWEGVNANGLPTPVFNFLKRVTMFQVASITSDNIAARVSAALCTENQTKAQVEKTAQIVSDELAQVFEFNGLTSLVRSYVRNAAVDGDGCIYTYFDPEIENGQKVKGAIRMEIVENTRVHFGNPNDRDVQSQPYLILSRRLPVEDVQYMAEQNGASEDEIDQIKPDRDSYYSEMDSYNDDRVTLLTYFWRNRETREIWWMETTDKAVVRDAENTKLKRYPLIWLCWDYRQDCMHGQASITGLRPNQMYINRMFAMVMISQMTTAFPKVIYDRTRIPGGWDPSPGKALALNGGNPGDAVMIVDPKPASPQISQFIQLAAELTQNFLGASDVAMGDARPDNTSAIIALQRAANTPLELTKQNVHQSLEDEALICMDMMRVNYGERMVEQKGLEGANPNEPQPFGLDIVTDASFLVPFDFGEKLKDLPMNVKVDIGGSSYWSEIASMQTMDNLLMQNKIDLLTYLERIPTGYILKKEELIEQIKRQQQAQMAQMAQMAQPGGSVPPEGLSGETDVSDSIPVPLGAGNGALQRAIVADEGGMKM